MEAERLRPGVEEEEEASDASMEKRAEGFDRHDDVDGWSDATAFVVVG